MDLDNGQIVELYEKMLLIRRFEEQSGRLYMQGKIHGFLHLYIGEEAIAVGAISTLRDDDYIITHYRDHGHAPAAARAAPCTSSMYRGASWEATP